tara:strand:+ start:325 stop:1563 length:1239 start_codon:yes stop_codon:yes gene_type:complete
MLSKLFDFIRNKKSYILFIFARSTGLIVKPLTLFLLINFGLDLDAELYSKYLICLISIYSIFKAPLHFDYYKLFFSLSKKVESIQTGALYKIRTISLTILLSPILYLLIYAMFLDHFISIFVLIALITEKLFDEVQRFQQYSKFFIEWSALFLFKNFFPLAFCFFIATFKTENIFLYFLVVSIFSNIFFTYLFSSFKIKITYKYFLKAFSFFSDVLKKLFHEHGLKFLVIISFTFFMQIDRLYVTIFLGSDNLADISFMAQIANGIPILFGFAFIHSRKAFFTRRTDKIRNLIDLSKAIIFFIFLLPFSIGLYYFILKLSSVELIFSIHFILFYFLSFSVLSLDMIFNEYQFWNQKPSVLLFIDIFCMIIFLFFMYLYDKDFLAIALFLSVTIRLLLHIALEIKSKKIGAKT